MKVEIANFEHPESCRTLDFVLDADAFQTIVPGEILVELGIKPYATDPLGRKKDQHWFVTASTSVVATSFSESQTRR